MAYNVPNNAILELQHRYVLQGQQCINVYHYAANQSINDAGSVLETYMGAFDVDVANVIQSYQTSECVNGRIRGQWVYPTRYVAKEVAMADQVGTQLPPTVSIGTCLVVKKQSEVASRSARGRVFIGGLAGSYLVVGTWTNAFLAAPATAIQDALKLNLDDAGTTVRPVIWSYSDPENADNIVTTLCDQYARYQRRREVGRGI